MDKNKELCVKAFSFKNKTIEIQWNTYWENDDHTVFSWHFDIDKKCDHAGLKASIQIFRRYFHFWICDNRHWDEGNQRFKND